MTRNAAQSALLLFLLPLGASAQSCKGARSVTTAEMHKKSCAWQEPTYYPACQRLSTDASPLIFTATVDKIVSRDGELVIDGKCSKTLLQTVTLRRIEVFRGQVPEVLTLEAGDLNGFYFTSHHRYLVFAFYRADGKLAVDGYGHTRAMKEAAEDVAYMRSFAGLPSAGEIFGDAYRNDAKLDERRMMVLPLGKPLTGTIVSVSGAVQRQTKIDRQGHYRFGDLPPGELTIELHSGPNVVWGAKRKVNLSPRRCAKVDFEEVPFNPEIAQRSLLPDELCPDRPH